MKEHIQQFILPKGVPCQFVDRTILWLYYHTKQIIFYAAYSSQVSIRIMLTISKMLKFLSTLPVWE